MQSAERLIASTEQTKKNRHEKQNKQKIKS